MIGVSGTRPASAGLAHGANTAEVAGAEWGRGLPIIGILPHFADPEAEAAYLRAQADRARRQCTYILAAAALLPGFSILAALYGFFDDRADVVFFGPALVQLAACAGFFVLLRWLKGTAAVRLIAVCFAVFYLAVRCAGIDGLPALAESSAAMVIGTVILLYGLPLPLGLLAPLLAAGSVAMLATWIGRVPRPPNAAILQMSQWVVMVNLVGFFGVRMQRFTMRQQWAQMLALRHMATHDGLTCVANRRHFEHVLASEWSAARAADAPISLILLDVDFFKLLNDGIGHRAGDSCLRDLAVILQGALREPGEFLARIGGEEFAVLLPGSDPARAGAAARRIMAAVREARIAHPCSPVGPHLTVSLGVATAYPASGASAWELTSLADRLVYAAKSAGRNCLRQDRVVQPAPAGAVAVPVP